MNDFVPISHFFSAVYMVDFRPSLCTVPRHQLARLGWGNVCVVCADNRTFVLDRSEDVPERRSKYGAPGSKHRVKVEFVAMPYLF